MWLALEGSSVGRGRARARVRGRGQQQARLMAVVMQHSSRRHALESTDTQICCGAVRHVCVVCACSLFGGRVLQPSSLGRVSGSRSPPSMRRVSL